MTGPKDGSGIQGINFEPCETEMNEQNTMTPLLIRIRKIMVSFGDLKHTNDKPDTGLSNGEILERLQEIDPGPPATDDTAPEGLTE